MRGGAPLRDVGRRLRRNLTDAERALWRELRRSSLGWRFRRQFPIPPYIVDFACLEARLVIEVDGGQHATSLGDVLRDARLRRRGWRILRFWNNEVLKNRTGVLEKIAEALGPWPATCPHPNPPRQRGRELDPPMRAVVAAPLDLTRTVPLRPPPPLAGEGWGWGY